MAINLALDCKEFEEYLVDTYEDTILDHVGIHYIFRFPNAYGASVVKAFGCVGYSNDMWELAIILYDEKDKRTPDEYMLVYPYSILEGKYVLGPLNDAQVRKILEKIKRL